MTQNLRLAGGTVLTPTDSNITTNFTLPESTASFSSPDPSFDGNRAGQMYNGTTVYGAYYSFNAATAGAIDGESGTASQDICPLGWKLPTGGNSASNFDTLAGLYPAGNLTGNENSAGWTTDNGVNGRWLGAENTTSGAFFIAAGSINTNGNDSINQEGGYWSSVAYSSSFSYRLNFTRQYIRPSFTAGRLIGFPIRCIAK